MSGGQCQRVMIAMAIACNPKLLIADEPTTALDVTIQEQILDLLVRLQAEHGMGLIMITHNMGVVAETADRVVVQYKGRKMEEARRAVAVRESAAATTRKALLSASARQRDGRPRCRTDRRLISRTERADLPERPHHECRSRRPETSSGTIMCAGGLFSQGAAHVHAVKGVASRWRRARPWPSSAKAAAASPRSRALSP